MEQNAPGTLIQTCVRWTALVVIGLSVIAATGNARGLAVCYILEWFGPYHPPGFDDCDGTYVICPSSVLCRAIQESGKKDPSPITIDPSFPCSEFVGGGDDTDGDGLCEDGDPVIPSGYIATGVPTQTCDNRCVLLVPGGQGKNVQAASAPGLRSVALRIAAFVVLCCLSCVGARAQVDPAHAELFTSIAGGYAPLGAATMRAALAEDTAGSIEDADIPVRTEVTITSELRLHHEDFRDPERSSGLDVFYFRALDGDATYYSIAPGSHFTRREGVDRARELRRSSVLLAPWPVLTTLVDHVLSQPDAESYASHGTVWVQSLSAGIRLGADPETRHLVAADGLAAAGGRLSTALLHRFDRFRQTGGFPLPTLLQRGVERHLDPTTRQPLEQPTASVHEYQNVEWDINPADVTERISPTPSFEQMHFMEPDTRDVFDQASGEKLYNYDEQQASVLAAMDSGRLPRTIMLVCIAVAAIASLVALARRFGPRG